MKIGNYLNLFGDQDNSDLAARRLDRLEKRRDYLSQNFAELQQSAIDRGDSEEAKKLFELSETLENRLDRKLDRLEERTGEFKLERRLDNFLDDMRADAYAKGDTEMAEKIFGLSQVIEGGNSDSQKMSLLQGLISDMLDTDAKTEVTAEAVGNSVTAGSSTGTSSTGTSSTGTSSTGTSSTGTSSTGTSGSSTTAKV